MSCCVLAVLPQKYQCSLITCFMLEFSATPVISLAPWFIGLEQTSNRAFPSYLVPLFQSETFHEFNLHVNKHVGQYISILMVCTKTFDTKVKGNLENCLLTQTSMDSLKIAQLLFNFFVFQSCYCSGYKYICMHTLHNLT